MDAREEDLGGGQTGAVSLDLSRTLLVGGGFFSSLFLIRTACHANGYYAAWPGWAVSISVLPLTILFYSWLNS